MPGSYVTVVGRHRGKSLAGLPVVRFLIGGQSNASGRGLLTGAEPASASVRVFGNDYGWRTAAEPIDSATGQVDSVSDDGSSALHSFALRAAKGLYATVARRVELIPCAKGGSSIGQWMPAAGRLDRTTLYGSANYRRSVAAPSGLTGLWWFGHESNTDTSGLVATYTADWTALVAELRADYGAVPLVYAQLAKHATAANNTRQHQAAEQQRLMETGSGHASALASHFMVVTFDLPLIDVIHLNAPAQRTLGDRFALATRQHLLGESINGTGPRLVSCTHPGADKSKVKVKTSRTLAVISGNADSQFRVYDGGVEMTVLSVVRDTDTTAALITMSTTASGTVTVSYGDRVASGTGVTLSNVLKDSDGLPLPQFGVQTVT